MSSPSTDRQVVRPQDLDEQVQVLGDLVRPVPDQNKQYVVPVVVASAGVTQGPWAKSAALRWAAGAPLNLSSPGYVSQGSKRPYPAYMAARARGAAPAARGATTLDDLRRLAVADDMAMRAAQSGAADDRWVVEIVVDGS